MALNFLSVAAGSSSSAKCFDIRLNDDYIVFRGNGQEAASAHLRGKLVIRLRDSLTIKYLKLSLTGVSKVANVSSSGSSRKNAKECSFFNKVWSFRDPGKGKTETLKADNYEYPFDVVLEGSLPESVEGLSDSFVIYRFKAEIGRKYAKNIVIRKPLRIIRTVDPNALELAHVMTVANVWPGKIEYSISTPSKAVIYGTSIHVEFRLVPLLKGLRIGTISTQVLETQEFSLNPEALSTFLNCQKCTRVVAEDEYQVPEDAEIVDEESEGHRFSRHLDLPKSLTKCLQDAETRGIRIRHKLKFNIILHNPDEHTSELRATLPVSLYISPSLAINDNNEVADQSPIAARRAIETDLTHQAPPLYGDHQLDQMYSGLDPNGYRTPGTFSTPGTPFGSRSRNISSENLAALDAMTGGAFGHAADGIRSEDVSAAALRHRLQELRSGPSPLANEGLNNSSRISPDPHRFTSTAHGGHQADYFSIEESSGRSPSRSSRCQSPSFTPGHDRSSNESGADNSGRTSDEDYRHVGSADHTPGPQFYEVEYLSRVPSYSTAVRAPAPAPYSGPDLPSYGDVTSGAPSLSSSPPGGQAVMDAAPAAHPTGEISGAATSLRGGSGLRARDLHFSGVAMSPGRVHGRTFGEIQDEERRLRLMQARGRG